MQNVCWLHPTGEQILMYCQHGALCWEIIIYWLPVEKGLACPFKQLSPFSYGKPHPHIISCTGYVGCKDSGLQKSLVSKAYSYSSSLISTKLARYLQRTTCINFFLSGNICMSTCPSLPTHAMTSAYPTNTIKNNNNNQQNHLQLCPGLHHQTHLKLPIKPFCSFLPRPTAL